jgi:predicted RNase H-like HicB family nuclease
MHAGKENRKRAASQYSEEGGLEVTRDYLVVYEKGEKNWSAFSPDIAGCGSLGDTLEDTRANMQEAVGLYLSETAKAAEPIPEAITSVVDFKEFDPGHEMKQYVVEWMKVKIPEVKTQPELSVA